jgi:hypothetical protein
MNTNKLSGTVLTTSNTNVVSNSIWAATSTNTTYTPNIGNTFVYNGPSIDQQPFNIRFNWDNKEVVVSLKDGNDVFKLANKFMKWLDMNEIEYNVKTRKRKK